MKKRLLFMSAIMVTMLTKAQEVNIIPQPAAMTVGKGSFTITPKTKIVLTLK